MVHLSAVYLLLEPMAAGKDVVDLTDPVAASAGSDRLKGVGATVRAGVLREGRLNAGDQTADLVLWLDHAPALHDDRGLSRSMAELARVVRPRGFVVMRVPVGALLRPGTSGRTLARGHLERLARNHFRAVLLIEESRFVGAAFTVPGVDAAAVNEALCAAGGAPSHFLAFCAPTTDGAWDLPESLLVPLGFQPASDELMNADAAAAMIALSDATDQLKGQVRALQAERDALREAATTLEDQRDRYEESLAALRREGERQLARNTETAAALELAQLDRDRLERQALSAEESLAAVTAALELREAEAMALRAETSSLREEVARLRAWRRDAARIRPERGGG